MSTSEIEDALATNRSIYPPIYMYVPNGSWRLPKSMRGRLRARTTLTWSVPFCALDAPLLLLVVLDKGGDVTVFSVDIFCFFGSAMVASRRFACAGRELVNSARDGKRSTEALDRASGSRDSRQPAFIHRTTSN